MSGEAFAIEQLRSNPQQSFETIRQVAEQAGVSIQPIHYGRARRQLGLTSTPPVAAHQPPAPQPAAHQPAAPKPAPAVPSTPATSAAAERAEPTAKIPTLAAAEAPRAEPEAATKKSTPGFEFLLDALRADENLSYGDANARAKQKGLKIAPIMYGRAKALLGLVPVAARGAGKNRKPSTRITPTTRPSTSSEDSFGKQLDSVRSVQDLVQIIKQLDDERQRLRSVLEQIADSIHEVLH
jgi:hypothetical protein